MKSTFLLVAAYGTSEIPLENVCEDLFGCCKEVAYRKAAVQSLPVPVYRATRSQKGKWLISADVLGKYLDEQKEEAEKLFNAMQPLRDAG